MKRISLPIVIMSICLVFILCFMIGRSNAMKDNNNDTEIRPETKQEKLPDRENHVPASTPTENVEKVEIAETKPLQEVKEAPPERMNFPCGQTILKDYSQQAVYSKTMGDWRAHLGVDYKAEIDSPVASVWDGTVSNVYKDVLWGYTVEIIHEGEIKSVYKNLSENILVKKGEKVTKGQAIGKVGDSAGVEKREEAHLHFEIWANNMQINPNSYIY